jgi:hypothetical protein
VRDDDVFAAIVDLASAGEYLDQIPGKVGVDLDGGGVFTSRGGQKQRRIYYRGSRSFLDARARGWIDPLPPLQPAPPAAIDEAEELAGAPLPALLRRLYAEVGNGGFGPGYGVLGLRGGHTASGLTAVDLLQPTQQGADYGPVTPFVLCDWGCAITSMIDLNDGQIWGCDPNPGEEPDCFPQGITVAEWFAKWLDGRLYQPWLREDPITGEWRGATDAETEAELEESDSDVPD